MNNKHNNKDSNINNRNRNSNNNNNKNNTLMMIIISIITTVHEQLAGPESSEGKQHSETLACNVQSRDCQRSQQDVDNVLSALDVSFEDEEAGLHFTVPQNAFDISPTCHPEVLACSWLSVGKFVFSDLHKLFEMLPDKMVKRHQSRQLEASTGGEAIHLGAWVHGGQAGIMNAAKQFPNVVKLLCRLLHTLHGSGHDSTVFLALNVPSSLHTDPRNHEAVAFGLIPLSKFDGGEHLETHHLHVYHFHGQTKACCDTLVRCSLSGRLL